MWPPPLIHAEMLATGRLISATGSRSVTGLQPAPRGLLLSNLLNLMAGFQMPRLE